MIRRALDWLANAKSVNAKLNDEMATLKFERDVLAWANKELKAELKAARAVIAADHPLVAYALRQKANRAKYDAKRRRK